MCKIQFKYRFAMQKLQDSVFSIVKTSNLSPAVFSFLQPNEDFTDKTPLGGILKDTKHGWLALGPKFCVVDLRTGLKVAARTFGTPLSNFNTSVTSVVELPNPIIENSKQLIISLQNDDCGIICIFHVNGSQLLHCIETDVIVTELAVCDRIPDGPFTCFDGIVMAGTKAGEIFAFDLNRACLIQALKDISQGYDHLIKNETNPANLNFLQYKALHRIENQRELALENYNHLAFLLNENSIIDGQYIFRNPDGTVRMKAKRDHVRVTVLQYIPQLGSLVVGYNFGAFQIWNIMTLDLEFTSQVNVECLPVTHFGFQEPCDDPRAFCYLWVVFSVTDRFEEEEFPLGVMYSLTYQGKRMLSDTKHLYQEFSSATIRFQLELGTVDEAAHLIGGKCVSCHTYSINSTLAAEGEESMLNICQIVWECWGDNTHSTQYGMLLFDLDQWYKDQMPATWRLESSPFMSVTWCTELSAGACVTLDVRLDPASVAVYSHATRLEEHFYPNSLQYNCICLNTSETCVLNTIGIQRQIISSIDEVGPTALLNPPRLYNACVAAGLTPLYMDTYNRNISQEEQRRFLLSVALEARLSRFLKRCAHDWATGSHSGVGCTLTFLVDWCWQRAIDLKENAKELTAPLFISSALPDRNVVRCLEHCVQQLTLLTGLLDAVLTKCCNLIVPDALSEIEEKYKGIGTVSLYFQVVQWFLRVGLLPERHDSYNALPYPAQQLYNTYNKRRLKLNRLQDNAPMNEEDANKPCSLLYIDQLIEQEFGGERIRELWKKGGSECNGLYPPPTLYSLLRLYLLCDVAEEHKHSLVLYLLVDYSMVYDDVRYEAVIRRLMQFPTMFGLSNTAIKATQAFWHLDHRDFDFALDQLQCLTGNTLSEWQHHVVLSTLLAQNKTQAALQYLHVRKPAPVQNIKNKDGETAVCPMRINDLHKLEDWQPCCNLYLARGLVFEALDVIRICVQNAASVEDKIQVLNFFFKGCRNTGNLGKLLQVTLLPFEEEVFIKYLEDCNDTNTSDILVMYYLQNSRYLEAERYNNKLKHNKPRSKDVSTSYESLFDVIDRENARDSIVEVVCSSLPTITNTVAKHALDIRDIEHVIMPKPMSVYVKAKSPKNTFTYKSSFIQDTIENASETWINKPKMRRGIKRALNIEETPFICTPKLNRTRSILTASQDPESTPPKRSRLDFTGTPKTPKVGSAFKVNTKLSNEMSMLLDMPDVQSPECKLYNERQGAETPHSILKIRRTDGINREAPSPVDSRYLNDSDDELLETASNHTHYSDSTNKHLRFTIPTPHELEPSPSPRRDQPSEREKEPSVSAVIKKEMDISNDSYVTTPSHPMNENHPLESPPKKMATEEIVASKKRLKDNVRGRLSMSMNSSLSDDPNTSVESIADIPVTLINTRYMGERLIHIYEDTSTVSEPKETIVMNVEDRDVQVPRTPKGRRSIRAASRETTPLVNRNLSVTPERQESPIALRNRTTRSRSRTPELSPRQSPLAPIPEQPKQEVESEPHPEKTMLSVPRQLRNQSRSPDRREKSVSESPKLEVISESPTKSSSNESSLSPAKRNIRNRSRTPERKQKGVIGSPKLEALVESPTKSSSNESIPSSPAKRSLRSRSRTPDVEIVPGPVKAVPRTLRSRSKTPEKLMSTNVEISTRGKKSLSRLVLEANTFAKTKPVEKMDTDSEETQEEILECTPMKTIKQIPSLMDVTLSPIVNKSVLQSSTDNTMSESVEKDVNISSEETDLKSLPAFTTLQEPCIDTSILHSYEHSTIEKSETSVNIQEEKLFYKESTTFKSLLGFTINETKFGKSVLHSCESSVAEVSSIQEESTKPELNSSKPFAAFVQMIQPDFVQSVLKSAQSSIAEISGVNPKEQDCSSLITNDSDADIRGKEHIQDTAAVIQKEKEKIVEIEREINEIEDDISGEENESSDEEDLHDEESEESENENDTSEEESSGEDEEVISIKDSDESDSNSYRIQIDEPEMKSETEIKSDENPLAQTHQDDQNPVDIVMEVEKVAEVQSSSDLLNQANYSLLTDDNSGVDSDKSDINLNYSEEKQEDLKKVQVDEPVVKTDAEIKESVSIPEEIIDLPNKVDVMDSASLYKDNSSKQRGLVDMIPLQENISHPTKDLENQEIISTNILDQPKEDIDIKQSVIPTPVIETSPEVAETVAEVKSQEFSKKEHAAKALNDEELKTQQKQTEKPTRSLKRTKSTSSNKSTVIETSSEVPETVAEEKSQESSEKEHVADATNDEKLSTREKDTEKPTRSRNRTKSTSSNKSIEPEIESETKTTVTRKRTQSNSSAKSIEPELKTPESVKSLETNTPRRRAKTPTSTEIRKIITRRVSREMAERDDSKLFDESKEELLSPKRRSTRSRSRNIDDNESIASESSVVSGKSRVSEDGDRQLRKGKKSVLTSKPELSVIPEIAAEEKMDTNDGINEYTDTIRLTRHQKSLMDSLMEVPKSPRRRPSTTSRASRTTRSSRAGESEDDDDEDSDVTPAFDVQPIDRISLLNKTDFEGLPDMDELQTNLSLESLASDASKQRRTRLTRAASESKTTAKASKIKRRISVDVVSSPQSPASTTDDAISRGRRASFNRACEALHTPKGRRTSTDLKKADVESPVDSLVETEASTPARRSRRTASSASVTSGTSKSESGKRSKKTLDENKDTKKK